MEKQKMRLIIIKEETGEELFNDVTDDFNFNLSNDLGSVIMKTGMFQKAPMYSRGYSLRLNGYFKNPNLDREYKEALKEAEDMENGRI